MSQQERWERLGPDGRFRELAEMWPRLPKALQVALMGLIASILAELLNNSKSPEAA